MRLVTLTLLLAFPAVASAQGLGTIDPLFEAVTAAGRAGDLDQLRALEAEVAERPGLIRAQLRADLAIWTHELGDTAHGRTLAAQAVDDGPQQAFPHLARARIAMDEDDRHVFHRHSDRALELAPEMADAHFLGAIADAQRDEWDGAHAHVARARELGFDAATVDQLEADLEEAEPVHVWDDYAAPLLLVLLAWAALMALLLLAGAGLSRWTLSRTQAIAKAGGAAGSGPKRAYAVVLWLSCALYYISIPLAVLVLLAAAAGLFYLFFAIGRIPIKLAAIIAIGVVITLWAVLKAVFAMFFAKEQDPGQVLDLHEHPALRAALEEVAEKIGTAPVDVVFMTPGTDIAVFERGGFFARLRGATERCLILGVGVLEGLSLDAFKAILAHEYGHFRNEDTAGGGFALSVRRSLHTMAIHMAQGGAATRLNPVWLFLEAFHRVFLRISQGASRLQEYMADRWAALAYGAKAFEEGLRHVVARSVRFDVHAQATLHEVIEAKRALPNLYAYQPDYAKLEIEPDAIEKAIEEALTQEAHPLDSHPAPMERFAFVAAVDGTGREPAEGELAWDLFADRDALERWMTDEVRQNVAASGALVPAA